MVMLTVTTKNTPIFNTPHLDKVFSLPMPLDKRFLLNEIETVLYPNVVVKCTQCDGDVVKVETEDYPSKAALYTHRSFLDFSGKQKEKKRSRPSVNEMISRLLHFPKLPYVWGGSFPEGVSSLLEIYPPKRRMLSWEWHLSHLRGIDCSGLLYNVTNGTIPRNSTPILKMCNEISIPSKPLDLIFFPGHVMIYLGGDVVIESKQYVGTCRSNLKSRIKLIERDEESIKFGRLL